MVKFKTGDKVVLISGKDKGKISIISKIIKKKNQKRFILEGINLLSKNTKPVPSKNKPGGIIKIEAPVSSSKIALLNPITQKKDKIFFKILKGKKTRIFRSNGEVLN